MNTDTIQTGRKARTALSAALLLLALAWTPLNAPGADPVPGPADMDVAAAPAKPGVEETPVRAGGQTHATAAKQKHKSQTEPKELPVFFIIGIAINFAMMTTFAWWFVGEWRKTKR